jgi:uncharacterized protein (DUF1697 family)
MTRYVAFLRAINVGGRRVAMADLRAVGADLGHDDVTTHIASGNVIFTARARRATLEPALEAAFQEAFGFDVPTFVRTQAEVEAVVEARPFDLPVGHTHLVALLRTPPDRAGAEALAALATPHDALVLDGDVVHWHIHGKTMDSEIKPSAWDRTGVGPTTTRNITMLTKLAAKLAG